MFLARACTLGTKGRHHNDILYFLVGIFPCVRIDVITDDDIDGISCTIVHDDRVQGDILQADHTGRVASGLGDIPGAVQESVTGEGFLGLGAALGEFDCEFSDVGIVDRVYSETLY